MSADNNPQEDLTDRVKPNDATREMGQTIVGDNGGNYAAETININKNHKYSFKEIIVFFNPNNIENTDSDLKMSELDIEGHFGILQKKRLLFITSYQHKGRYTALQDILLDKFANDYKPNSDKLSEKTKWNYCQLDFGKIIAGKNIVQLSDLVMDKMAEVYNTILLINLSVISNNDAKIQLAESLKDIDNDDPTRFKEFLENNDSHVITLISPDLAEELKSLTPEFPFDVWKIDDRESKSAIEKPASHSIIEKTVLFTTTYFRELGFRSFNKIVELLLSQAPEEIKIGIDDWVTNEDGIAELKKTVTDRSALEEWQLRRDYYLKKCLIIGKREDGLSYIDFLDESHRDSFEEYFQEEEHFFWQQQCETLLNQGKLFDPELDDRTARSLIVITTMAVNDDTQTFSSSWLLRGVSQLNQHLEQSIEITEENILDQLVQFVSETRWKKDFADTFFSRLAQVLRELFKYDHLKSQGDDLFERLINSDRQHELLRLLNLLTLRYNSDDFDRYYWIKQLLERGNSDIKGEAYNLLFYRLGQSNSIQDTWDKLKSWIENAIQDSPQNFPFSKRYSLLYLIHFSIERITRPYQIDEDENTLYLNPFFIIEEKEKGFPMLSFLMEQAFTKGMIAQFQEPNEDIPPMLMSKLIFYGQKRLLEKMEFEEGEDISIIKEACGELDYFSLLADIVENWFYFLKEREKNESKEKYHFGSKKALKLITELIKEHAMPGHRQKLISHWSRKGAVYSKLDRTLMEKVDMDHSQQKEVKRKITDFKIHLDQFLVEIDKLNFLS